MRQTMAMRRLRQRTSAGGRIISALALSRIFPTSAAVVGSPCAPQQAELLRAILSKLPPNALVTDDQLRSMMGVWSVDLCGLPLKQLSGSWGLALKEVLGPSRNTDVRGPNNGRPPRERYIVPASPTWSDPRPPPQPSTRCLGDLIPGSTTWLTNDADACDDLLDQCDFESAPALGFDLEWTPTMVVGQRAEMALLQLATREHCLLLRVGQMRQMGTPLPSRIVKLLEGHPPVKVGRGIRNDAKLVRAELGLALPPSTAGLIELPGRDSLKTLARQYASFPIPTEGKLSWCTNWDARCVSSHNLPQSATICHNLPQSATTCHLFDLVVHSSSLTFCQCAAHLLSCCQCAARELSTESLRYAALDAIAAVDVHAQMPRSVEAASTLTAARSSAYDPATSSGVDDVAARAATWLPRPKSSADTVEAAPKMAQGKRRSRRQRRCVTGDRNSPPSHPSALC